MEVWRIAVGVATRRSGGLKARCRCSDVEVWRSEGSLQVQRRGGTEVWRNRCRCSDVGV